MHLPDRGAGPAWLDLDRPPLRAGTLSAAVRRTAPWRELHVLDEVGSTNDLVVTAARGGEREGLVVVAESQSGGRGRLDREWSSPPRAGLTWSMLLRPSRATAEWPWLPLLVASCIADSVGRLVDLTIDLKWPNDLLVDGRKVGGLLAEVAGSALAVGVGLNVSTAREELPVETATSLSLETGGVVDRQPVFLAALRAIGPAYLAWNDGELDARATYLRHCATVGQSVRVALPGGDTVAGEAADVDETGRLVVRTIAGDVAVSAGDVVQVRPA